MKRLLTAVTGVLLLSLAACSAGGSGGSSDATSGDTAAFLADHDLAGLDGPAIVDRLEALDPAARPADYKASVRPHEVLLTEPDGGREASLPLPDDVFYLALAPYRDGTHDCFFHSPTSCQGELSGATIHVTVTADDGAVLVDEDTATHPDGFVAYWLPRGSAGTVEMSYGDTSGTYAFTTDDEAPTCVTTVRLT